MNEVLIRQVKAADVTVCAEIEALCFEPTEAASLDNIQIRQQQYPHGFLIAEIDQQIVGFINCGATNKPNLADEAFKAMVGHEDNGEHLVIFSVAVQPCYQRKGIASELMNHFIMQTKQANKSRILLLCKTELISFYEKFGFLKLGKSASDHGGASWWEMQYQV